MTRMRQATHDREAVDARRSTTAGAAGFVTRFEVRSDFIARYEVREAGGRTHLEYWIPAEDLAALNEAIVGQIEVVLELR